MIAPAPGGSRASAATTTRAWWVATGAVTVFALASRVRNAFVYPPLHDFDGPGHSLNLLAFHEGRLPDPHAWVGFHAPLYHAVAAMLWAILPEAVPVHATARLLSFLAGAAAFALAARTLTRLLPPLEAGVATAFAFCVPAVAIATSMLGNETSCALFATAVLARLTAEPGPPRPASAAATGLLAGLAALAKSTGLLLAFVAAAVTAWRGRGDPRAALRATALLLAVAATVAAPHYLRLAAVSGGDPLAVISGAVLSPELAEEMASQPPGDRRLGDYLAVPAATFLAPVHFAPGMERSVPGLLHASLWADAHAQFLPGGIGVVLASEALLAVLGLLPTALALFGLLRILREPALRRALAPGLLFLGLLVVSLLRYCWIFRTFSAVKASSLLPALLPATAALAVGLTRAPAAWRGWLRGALLGIGALATAVTSWGWWE